MHLRTVFYPTGGGQEHDEGVIKRAGSDDIFLVHDVIMERKYIYIYIFIYILYYIIYIYIYRI